MQSLSELKSTIQFDTLLLGKCNQSSSSKYDNELFRETRRDLNHILNSNNNTRHYNEITVTQQNS